MGLFVSQLPNTSGVFAAKVPSPAQVTPTGTGASIIVGQFPWGPPNVEVPPGTLSLASLFQVFNPPGSNRLNSAYLSMIRKGWPNPGAVRAAGPSAVGANVFLTNNLSQNVVQVFAAYPGSLGNSIIATVGASGDGNTNHWKLTLSLSGNSGTTLEIYDNLNTSGVGPDVLPSQNKGVGNVTTIGAPGSNVATSVLAASVTKVVNGVPAAGNYVLGGGTDGTVTATQYVGSQGQNDFGFALLESDRVVNNVFTDDCGSSLRAAVNTGLVGHVTLTSDRIGFINGNSGQTAAAAQSDVSNYRSPWICYVDPWTYIFDDVTGAMQLTPPSCWGASLASQMPPSLSIAWRAVGSPLMSQIKGLEQNRGSAAGNNTSAGISTIDYGVNGGFYFEQDVNTSAVSGQSDLLSSRMDQFLGRSVVNAWQPYVNAPNINFFQQDLLNSLQQFLQQLKDNTKINPAVLPFIANFSTPSTQGNTPTSIAQGIFQAFAQVAYGSSMKQVVFQLQSGVGVQISSS